MDADFWQGFEDYIELGREVAGDPFPSVFATADHNWWGFLQSCEARVGIAKFPLRDENRVLVLDPSTKKPREQIISGEFVIREVYEVPPIKEIQAFVAAASQRTDEYASRTRLVVIYPALAFLAVVGKITSDIRDQGYEPEQVRSVQIRYRQHAASGYDFEITMLEPRS